jgi:hypothetical protein
VVGCRAGNCLFGNDLTEAHDHIEIEDEAGSRNIAWVCAERPRDSLVAGRDDIYQSAPKWP